MLKSNVNIKIGDIFIGIETIKRKAIESIRVVGKSVNSNRIIANRGIGIM